MAAHLFNESGQMQEVDIPDIFDVLEGGEDENAVKFLLGFAADDHPQADQLGGITSESQTVYTTTTTMTSGGNSVTSDGSLDTLLTKEGKPRKRDPVDPSRCIYNCDNCNKAFTTKFNLKRHINLHCSPSKEAGVPVQGPPSASMPSRKARERREALAAMGLPYERSKGRPLKNNKKSNRKSKSKKQKQPLKQVTTSTTHSVLQQNPQQVITVQSLPTTATTAAGPQQTVGRLPQQQQTISFQNNNNQKQQQQYTIQQQHPVAVRISASVQPQQQPTIQLQHHHHQQQQQVKQQIPEQTYQIIKMVQQQPKSQHQQQQQQRIVHFVQNDQTTTKSNLPQTIVGQIQDANRIIPIFQQIQGIPVTVSLDPLTNKVVFSQGTIQLPQQPLPNIHPSLLQQFKPITTAVVNSNRQLPTVTAVAKPRLGYAAVSSHANRAAATVVLSNEVPKSQQQQQQLQPQQQQQPTPPQQQLIHQNVVGTLTQSSVLPSRCQTTDQELTCPPDDLFDSEDEDASSVATTTEAPSPASVDGDEMHNGFTVIQGGGSYTTENECKVTTDVNGATLVSVTVTSESNKSSMDLDDGSNAALNLPSNPKREQLQEIPRGWLRKIITTGKVADQPKVYYYNTVGKKFSCQEEIDQYFSRLGQTVRPGLFNFEPPKLVDEDDDDDEDEEMEDLHQTVYGSGSGGGGGLQQKQQTLLA